MTQQFFEEYAKIKISKKIKLKPEDIYMVWFNYTLGNAKGMFSFNTDKTYPNITNIKLPDYIEVTFNKDKNEFYFDWYTKEYQEVHNND